MPGAVDGDSSKTHGQLAFPDESAGKACLLPALVIRKFDMSFKDLTMRVHGGRGFRNRPGSSLGQALEVKDAIPSYRC